MPKKGSLGITLVSPDVPLAPVDVLHPPVVYRKRKWQDEWRLAPQLKALSATAAVSGQDLGQAEFQRRYGRVAEQHEDTIVTRSSEDLRGWWVRIDLAGEDDNVTVWVGRISGERRSVHGESISPSGVQTWVAYEPLQLLRKIHVSRSLHFKLDQPDLDIGWVPDMNPVAPRNLIVGNRSTQKTNHRPGEPATEGSYVYGTGGAAGVWTRLDALEYVLRRFADERRTTPNPGGGDPIWGADAKNSGPSWKVGGQADVLAGISDTLRWGTSQTVAEMIRKIIPLRLGLDYTIRYVPKDDDVDGSEGFEIFVFALSATPQSFGGATLPANPNVTSINAGKALELQSASVIQSQDQLFSKIRVLGGRVVVCCSLGGNAAQDPAQDLIPGSLLAKWPVSLEDAYKAAAGSVIDFAANDAARLQDRFRPVYQNFGADLFWDHHNGRAAPVVDLDGNVDLGANAPVSDFQDAERRTLPWLPLLEGVDYSGVVPVNLNPPDHQADFLPPAVWLFGTPPIEEGAEGPPAPRHFTAEEAGVSVSVPTNDWGVILSQKPNHLLALNHFGGAASTGTEPLFDWQQMVATIAFESDQRLVMGADLPLADDIDPGGVMNIEMPEAQLWMLCAQTVVGVRADGTLIQTANRLILRNDAARMGLAVAGAVARYLAQRNRAEIVVKGLFPWSEMLGTIVTVAQAGDDTINIDAPITSVEYLFTASPTTTVRTGFAT